jgi:hypothetical protein
LFLKPHKNALRLAASVQGEQQQRTPCYLVDISRVKLRLLFANRRVGVDQATPLIVAGNLRQRDINY